MNIDLVGPLPPSHGFTHLLTTVNQTRGLHWDWVPLGSNPNLAGAGSLNFAAGGNGWLKQTLRERRDDGVNKLSRKKAKTRDCVLIIVSYSVCVLRDRRRHKTMHLYYSAGINSQSFAGAGGSGHTHCGCGR